MKKLLAFLLLGSCMVWMPKQAHAAASVRSPKAYSTILFTTTASSVAVNGAAAVYEVILSTGTSGTDFVSLYDAANIGAITNTTQSYKVRVNVSSGTQNTLVTFDPPLQFNNGIVAVNSASTIWSSIVFERGRSFFGN